jgi:hypothetical protein
MTRNAILLFLVSAGAFLPAPSFATADSPVVQGQGGAGRAGLPLESLFANPAAVGLLTPSSSFFLNYEKPRIPDWNAGGREYSVGVYDGTSEAVKGGFGYVRTSRALVDAAGRRQDYEDRSDFRAVFGRPVWGNIVAGVRTRYVTRRNGAAEKKFLDGDLGTIFPLYAGVTGALTYEHALAVAGEQPPTVGAGLAYALGDGLTAYADGYRLMQGLKKGDRGWALGLEVILAGDFRVRGGRFQDGMRRLKGWSLGLSWLGPRTSFQYAMRTTGTNPKEKDHIFGISVAM